MAIVYMYLTSLVQYEYSKIFQAWGNLGIFTCGNGLTSLHMDIQMDFLLGHLLNIPG